MTLSLGGSVRPVLALGETTSTRFEDVAPQTAGGGVAARLPGLATETGRAPSRRELPLDDGRPMDSVMFDETRPATGIIIPPELLTELAPGRPLHAVSRQTKAVLIHDEREAKPCFEVARDLRALDLKKHKRSGLAMKIANVAMPHDEIARRRGRRPVHNLVLNVLMSRWNREGEFSNRVGHNGRNNFKTRLTKNDCHICISAVVLGTCQLSLSRRKKIYARNFKVTLISIFRRARLLPKIVN